MALGAFAALFLALLYRALTFDNPVKALRGTAGISGMLLFIIVGATTFSQILSFSGASNGLVWFGVMFLICMQLGLLMPPNGLLLMTMKGWRRRR